MIELYQTVLNRGFSLSIEGSPAVIGNRDVDNALLLAAGRIADLYMLLGNEAYADAADPTIAFGTGDGQYGAEAASIHCFMNQTASLLEEELALLRGRDASKQPGVQKHPLYNRLIWNFTRDITGGEVAYALNYNIRNEDGDVSGTINEADAKVLYPQGHGDAWGHYPHRHQGVLPAVAAFQLHLGGPAARLWKSVASTWPWTIWMSASSPRPRPARPGPARRLST